MCRARTVVASEKGVVVGRLTFREDGDLINCQRMGVGGKAVPPNVDKVYYICNTSFLCRLHRKACMRWKHVDLPMFPEEDFI